MIVNNCGIIFINSTLTIFVHSSFLAFLKSTGSALIPVSFINNAAAFNFRLADILSVPSDGPLEKPGTTVTSEDSVVLSRTMVSTHFARYIVQNSTYKEEKNIKLQIKITYNQEHKSKKKNRCRIHNSVIFPSVEIKHNLNMLLLK